MTSIQFILRGLKHHRTGYLGVLLGSALGTMVLLGALFAGDSVKATLRQIAEQRIGKTEFILSGGENLFRSQLAADIGDTAAPVLQLRGQVSESTGRATGQVDLLGVDDRFWSFAPESMAPPLVSESDWAINRELADTLDLKPGDTAVIRLRKPGLVASDAPLAENNDDLITLRGKVSRVLTDSEMGRFSLQATQISAPKVFLPIATLSEAIEHPDRVNLVLFRDTGTGDASSARLESRIREAMQPDDYGLSLRTIPLSDADEIRTERIFLNPVIERKIRDAFPGAEPTLTYLVNTLASNGRETPYSMVTGADPALAEFLPDDMADDEIALNSWTAEDLAAKPGDTVELSYYVLGKNNLLTEEKAGFTVRAVYPLEGAADDRLWTPDFPGIAEAEDNADWESGLPIDTTRIRDKDETYWDDHRATPKAFVTHETAVRLWGNRWGSATALRIPRADRGQQSNLPASFLGSTISSAGLLPTDAGLHLRDIATESSRAASSPVDIASLFLSMSFFLIVAAVALTSMLFRFNIEQRNAESGLLTAVGIPAKTILRWRLAEGLAIVTIGAFAGAVLAFGYTRGLLLFLERIWNEGDARLFSFHASPPSVIGGILGFILMMMSTIWLANRKQAKRAASLRLTSGSEEIPPTGRRWRSRLIAVVFLLVALASLAFAQPLGPSAAFFLTGCALLISGLAFGSASLRSTAGPHSPDDPRQRSRTSRNRTMDPSVLARLNLKRRPTRSLVAIGTLASAIFLVVSVTAFQKHGSGDWRDSRSGTGGYGLWIETSNPLTRLPSGRFEFEDEEIRHLLPIRVGTGDDASCFNLNSVTRPRLLATDTSALESNDAFSIKSTATGIEPSWSALANDSTRSDSPSSRNAPELPPLRAYIDETTLLWVLKMKVGDTIDYTDEFGNSFPLLITGTLTESVFQGSFIVDEADFLQRFPSSPGYRMFLAVPEDEPEAARADLQSKLTDLGATVTPTVDRLASFHSVENTYITIFNILGGLGVILGSAGLGIVTARNLAERRDEFSILRTLGIPSTTIRSIVIREVVTLLVTALLIGLISALTSIIPSVPALGLSKSIVWIAGLSLLIMTTAGVASTIAYVRVARLSAFSSSSG